MTTFYINQVLKDIVFLNEINSRHAIKSLRLKKGDHIKVVNGNGDLFYSEILDPHPKKTELSILKKESYKKETPLILAFSPTKNNDRNEWVIEKGVEIGMTECYPIFSQNSERRKWNKERMDKIAISAMKQSGRFWLTKIHEPMNIESFLKINHPNKKFIAHCKSLKKESIHKLSNACKPQLILIGPEGDFTEKEIKMAEKNKFTPVNLGNNRLRTETACIASIALLKLS